MQPCGLEHAGLLCSPLSPGACSNSCPLSRWCHSTISSSVARFSCPQSCLASASFSTESALHIRWPKYWSFSFSINHSNEHSGLISFRMDWLDLLAVQGTLKSLLQHHSSKASISSALSLLYGPALRSTHDCGKTVALTRWTFVRKVMWCLCFLIQGLGLSTHTHIQKKKILKRIPIYFAPAVCQALKSWRDAAGNKPMSSVPRWYSRVHSARWSSETCQDRRGQGGVWGRVLHRSRGRAHGQEAGAWGHVPALPLQRACWPGDLSFPSGICVLMNKLVKVTRVQPTHRVVWVKRILLVKRLYK